MNMQNYPLNSRQQRKFASLARNTLPQKLDKYVQRNKSIKNTNPGITITYHQQEAPKRVYSNYMMKDINQKIYEPLYVASTLEHPSNLIKERKSLAARKTDSQQQFNIPRKSIQIHSHHRRQNSEIPQPVLQDKKSQSQVQKLTKICQEFYHQNQKLKLRLLQNDSTHIEQLNKRIMELDNEVTKSKEMIQNRNRQIAQMGGKLGIIDLSQKGHGFNRPSFTKLYTQNGGESKLNKIAQELRSKQEQLMRYMQKQSQYIQVYVEKQQLEHEIRRLVSIIQSQNKQLQENKHNARMRTYDEKYDTQCRECEDNKEATRKMTEFNQKLTGMLNMSSMQIQRLNNLLKIKVDVVESNRSIISQLKGEINTLKNRNSIPMQTHQMLTFKNIQQKKPAEVSQHQLDQVNKKLQQQIKELVAQIAQKNSKLSEYQLSIETLNRENKNLQLRLNDQVGVSFELRDFITKLQNQLKPYHGVEKKEAQINTQHEIYEQTKGEKQGLQTKSKQKKEQNQVNNKQMQISEGKHRQIMKNEDKSIDKVHLAEAEAKIDSYQKQINSFRQENQDLSKFIVRQNTEIIKLKDQIENLKLKQMLMEKNLQKLSTHQKQLPTLLNRVKEAQDKLFNARETYGKLLKQVQSSCSETESVHKQLEQMIEGKRSFLGVEDFKIAPMSTRSQTGHLIDRVMKKSAKNQGKGLDVSQAKSNQNRIDFEQQWYEPKSTDPQSTLHSHFQLNQLKDNY